MKPQRRHLHSIPQINEMLNARALELAMHVFPAGRRAAGEVTVKNLQGDPGSELSVCVRGAKVGLWKQFNATGKGTHGDLLDLVMYAECNGDKVAAIKWCKAWLGLDGTDPAALKRTHRAVEVQKVARPDDEQANLRGAAYRIVKSARDDIRGTLAERYLEGRGLPIRQLLFKVEALRFHPDLRASARDEPRVSYPAMVAPIYGFNGRFRAVHRTWLQEQADGRVTKAPLDNPKKTLGSYNGGFIPLWRGLVTDPETGEIRLAPSLRDLKAPVWVDLTEGIEDGATVALAVPEARVYVGVALASMAQIKWPRMIAGITIWQQNDPELDRRGQPHPARLLFRKVVGNYQHQGKAVRLARVPADMAKDPNEALQAMLAAEQSGLDRQSAGVA